jgi:hypothetical protein
MTHSKPRSRAAPGPWHSGACGLCLLLLACLPAAAQSDRIYRSIDAHGQTVFSDQPPSDDAEPIEMAPLMTFESPTLPGPAPHRERPAEQAAAYDSLAVVSPRDDEAVRSNVGDVSIRTRITPGLRAGHQLRLLLDDRVVESTADSGGIFNLTNVHRGTHVVRAQVVDDNGAAVIESEPVTFHMLQISVLTRPGT